MTINSTTDDNKKLLLSNLLQEIHSQNKFCPMCKQYQPINRFAGDSTTKRKVHQYCKDCVKQRNRSYYMQNKAKWKVYNEPTKKSINAEEK